MIGASEACPRDALTRQQIGGKLIVLFEKHHYALLPWHEWARDLGAPPRLLSIDYHTDSHAAFHSYGCSAAKLAGGRWWDGVAERWRLERLSTLAATDSGSVNAAVRDLRHDEHIDAALHADILDIAFLISRQQQGRLLSNEQLALDKEWCELPNLEQLIRVNERPYARPPFTYAIPKRRLVILDDKGAWHDQDSERASRDRVLESSFLQKRIDLIDSICTTGGIPCLFERPFILDIDLDAFNTRQSITPSDARVFYDLIRRAIGITIAQEPGCVAECQLDGEGLTAAWLESKLLAHIERAQRC